MKAIVIKELVFSAARSAGVAESINRPAKPPTGSADKVVPLALVHAAPGHINDVKAIDAGMLAHVWEALVVDLANHGFDYRIAIVVSIDSRLRHVLYCAPWRFVS